MTLSSNKGGFFMKKVWMYLLFVCGLMLSIAYCQTPGDINGDNKVNLTEAIHALKVTAGHGSSSIEGIK
jgi:hypothetical protein